MTINELLHEAAERNYQHVQQKIKDAMMIGKSSETFCLADYDPMEDWIILPTTIVRLEKDGFAVEEVLGRFDLFEGIIKISW